MYQTRPHVPDYPSIKWPSQKTLRRNLKKKLKLFRPRRQVGRKSPTERPSHTTTSGVSLQSSLSAESSGFSPLSGAIAAAPGRGATAAATAIADAAAAADDGCDSAARPSTSCGGRDGAPSGFGFRAVAEIHLLVASSDYVNLMGRERMENEISAE